MARSRVHRRKSLHKRKGPKRHKTRRHRSRRMRQRGGVGEECNTDPKEYKLCDTGYCLENNNDKKVGPGVCKPI